MAVKMTPDEFVEKHARRLSGATEDIRRGVEKVTEAPGIKAAAAQEKMKARLIASIDSGVWARRTRAVSVDDWRKKMINKGIPAISTGITEAADKVRSFAAQLLPAIDKAQGVIAGMPSVTLEQNISRATTFMREMAKFKKT